jgi:hypothetical protein
MNRPCLHNRILMTALWALLLGLLSITALFAQTPAADKADGPLPIEMNARLLDHAVYPGDPIRVEVSFKSPKPFGADVLGSLPLGKFELRNRDRSRAETDGGLTITHLFELAAYEPGPYETPRIEFVLRQGGREEERTLDAMRVTVKSLLEEEAQKIAQQQAPPAAPNAAPNGGATIVQPGGATPPPTLNLPGAVPGAGIPGAQPGMQPGQPTAQGQPGQPEPVQVKLEPRDIKGPVGLFVEDYTPAYLLGGIAALALLGLGIWWWLRRPRHIEEEIERAPVDTRPAHVIALARLDELERRQLVAKREIKAYHLELSEILRDYFKRRYELVVALSMTSSEIVGMLKGLYLRDLDDRAVAELLLAGDLVKFAKDEPTDEICHERLARARLIVERTKEAGHGVQ